MVLSGLGKGLHDLAWNAGDRFRVVTISIDPTDTVEMARAKRDNQIAAYGRNPGASGWDFLVGGEADVKRLAETVGFHYRYDNEQKQYAHAAAAFVVTPDGRLSRTLYGITFPERDLRLSLVEASAGKLGTPVEKFILFCYHYDPNARGYVLGAQRVMRAGGFVTMLALGFFLLHQWRTRSAHGQLAPVLTQPLPPPLATSTHSTSENPV
jgi:protein SCO1/2